MELTESQKEALSKKIENFLNRDCNLCEQRNWVVSDTIWELPGLHHDSQKQDARKTVFPIISVACKNCGATHLFSAVFLGLLGVPPKENETSAEEE